MKTVKEIHFQTQKLCRSEFPFKISRDLYNNFALPNNVQRKINQ